MFSKIVLVVAVFCDICALCTCRTVFDLPEGSPCTWGEHNGTCVDIQRCYTFILDKRDGRDPPICSFKGDMPVICCTECPELHVENISKATWDSRFGVVWQTGQISRDNCINNVLQLPYFTRFPYDYFEQKSWDSTHQCHVSVGGLLAPADSEDIRKKEYPYMALLGFGSGEVPIQWFCAGSLISDRFILTAAHCISTPQFGPVRHVALGVWKRSEVAEEAKLHTVKSIIPYPEYKSPFKYHDIALLEMEKRVEFTLDIVPACLQHRDDDVTGETIALGWGKLGPSQRVSNVLQKVKLHRYTDEECAAAYEPSRLLEHGYNSTTQMCYGDHHKIRDTCEGDSGGPLVLRRNVLTVQDTIIGVTSYGRDCGRLGDAGIYTRIDYYLPWIESIVWP